MLRKDDPDPVAAAQTLLDKWRREGTATPESEARKHRLALQAALYAAAKGKRVRG